MGINALKAYAGYVIIISYSTLNVNRFYRMRRSR